MLLPKQDITELTAKLGSILEFDIPRSADTWINAEEIARLYRLTAELDISRRYFRMAARDKEQRLMAFRMRDGKVSHATDCAHTALLYQYAGEADKAQSLFKQAVVEADMLLHSPVLNIERRSLLQMLLCIGLINGEYAKLDRYLDALKEVCTREPGSFLPVYEAVEMALQARTTTDKQLAEQAIKHLREFVVQEEIAPYAMGYISEWDILELLMAIHGQIP